MSESREQVEMAHKIVRDWLADPTGTPQQQRDKLVGSVARALAACALSEARWWLEKAGRDGHFWIVSPINKHPEDCRCEAHDRIALLERAAKGK